MTYTPPNSVTIETSFGATKLVVHSSESASILTSDIDGFLTINGVAYHGRLEFERPAGKNWQLAMKDNGHSSYISGISLRRCDDWSKSLSDAARKKLVKTIAIEVNDFLSTGEGLALGRSADERNDDYALSSARQAVEEARASLAAAEAKLQAILNP